VAATDWSDDRASYSNWGPEVELSAPGGDFENSTGYSQIASTCFTGDNDYCLKAGTSMATPEAAGAGALLYALGLSSAQEVLDRMKSTADDLGPAGPDPEFGFGRINLLAAIDGTGGGDPPPPPNDPPVSDFAFDCAGLACDFTDQSFDPDGVIVAWDWSFGDGSTSTLQSPSHTFACTGEYPVTLTVTDDGGGTGIGTHTVTVTGSTVGTENGPGAVPGLLLWLQADALEGFSDGDPVETWTDRSGRCHDASQADTSRQPQFWTNQINGRPAVLFDAVDDGMGTSLDPDPEVTVFAVYAGNNTIAGDVFNGGPSRFLLGPRSNRYGLFTGNWILIGSATPGRWVLHTARQSGSLSEAWIDGQDYGSASTVQDPGIVSIGRAGLGSTALDGALAELIWYDRPLSDAERLQIETWLMDKYFPPPSVNVPPFADFTSDCTDLECSFTDRSTDPDGTISAWDWAFGDSETSTDQSPAHAYAQAGTYAVTLTVTDDGGASDTRSVEVVVTEPAPGEFTDPSSLPGLALWLRTDALTGFVEGDRVDLWPDESTRGNDATQALPSKQPTYAPDVVNGLPALAFDAADDGLATPLNPPLETTVFVVYAFGGTGWGDVFSAGPSRFILGSRSRKHAVYTGGWTMHDRITVGRWVVHTVRQSTSMAEVWLDGDRRKTTKRVQDPSTVRLADVGTGSNPLNGWIAEVVWYDRPLTDQERGDVETWLLTKYAIP
jgi:PKD repeat protein